MSLAAALLDDLKARGIALTGVALDSRKLRPGDLFLAMPGAHADGRAFIADAIARGAVAVLAEAKEGTAQTAQWNSSPVPILAVEHLAMHAGEIAHLVHGRPSEQLWLCGVTGTNGKTSVTQWIAQAMSAFGCKCGVIGTLGNGFPPHCEESPNTTPDAVTLHATLARFVQEGAHACAMEVSSIGLDQGRVNGAHFDVAVLTNLTRDHLEYHGSLERYAAAKARLFKLPGLGHAVLNLDDPFGRDLAARLRGRVPTIGYTLEGHGGAERVLYASAIRTTDHGLSFMLDGEHFEAPVLGRFNVANLLAVTGALLAADETLADIAAALRQIAAPAGRMQRLGGTAGSDEPLVVIDYAHSPDALENVLATLRATAESRGGRLICVFGCGGERDAGKRPLMGAVAERCADVVVLTSDNPRGEDPLAIIAAILAGMRKRPAIEPDRARAITAALAAAEARDVVLLAGKGHETYQEVAGVRLPFSDLAAAQEALDRRRAERCRKTPSC